MVVQRRALRHFLELPVSALPRTPFIRHWRRSYSSPSNPPSPFWVYVIKKEHRIVVTLEDGVLDGGFGEKIARFYGRSDIKVLNYGLKKEILDRYNADEVMRKNRLVPSLILEDVKKILG